MKFRFGVVFLLLAAIPLTGYSQSASSAFSLTDKSASSTITNGSGGIAVGYARISANSGSTTPSGVAIFGYKPAGVLVTEAGVPASPLIKNGRIYAEVGPNGSNGLGTDIGMAIANPSTQTATISFSFTSSDGSDAGSGSYNLLPGLQFASFLDQSPWNLPLNFQGTFTFFSNVAISVVALQLFNNQRGEALITTLPVIDTTIAPTTTPAVLSHFTDGQGWSTSVLLVNPSDNPMTGTIVFRGQDGSTLTLAANGQTSNSFNYSVPRRSSFKLQTAGAAGFQSGSVTVTPTSGTNTPVSLAVFSFANSGVTVTQAGVPSSLGTAFRMYVEATPGASQGVIGSYSTGFAVANASSSAGTVTFDLYTAAGISTGLTKTLPIAAFGQNAQFLSDIFPGLTLPFQGVLRVTTSTPAISVVALRIRYNERGEFLMTTTPPSNEAAAATSAEFDFPHILNGGGFTTQFILFIGTTGQTSNGNLQFFKSDGTQFSLTVTSTISGAPVSLTSISPTAAAVGSTVTLTGTGFSASNTVVFTAAGGTVEVAPSAASTTTLTVTVPANAITGPVFVKNGSQTSASVILQVTPAGGGSTQTPVVVSASTTTSGTDIFVSTPVSALSFNAIGVGTPGTGIAAYPASATVFRGGPTQQLLLIGTGFSPTITVSVSGNGVTLSNLVFQSSSGAIFINIAVAANATPGTRNVIVTNANGDTSIMTGGLLIQ